MTFTALVFSIFFALDSPPSSAGGRGTSPGFIVWATIDAARILGLPFVSQSKSLTLEQKHSDSVWLMCLVNGPEAKIPRRKQFIRELITSNRITNFLEY